MSKNKIIRLVVLGLLLLLAVGAYFAVDLVNEREANKESTGTVEKKYVVEGLVADEVTTITVNSENGDFILTKEGDEWKYENDSEGLVADSDKVNSYISSLMDVSTDEIIENVENLSEYGYEEPVYTLRRGTSDNEYTLTIGDYNSVVSRYYVMNGNRVYALSISQKSSLLKEKEYFEKTEEE